MKQNYFHSKKPYLLLLVLISMFRLSFSQEKEMISPYLTFQYFKDSDNHRFLQTTLTYSKDRMELPLAGLPVSFREGNGDGVLLATINTNEKGIARYPVDDEAVLKVDKDGNWPFATTFSGNDSIEAATSELSIRDVNLQMEFSFVDSVRTIKLKANVNDKGVEKPVTGESVSVYVPRMFSLLPVGEGVLDDNGEATVEFPAGLPGDKDGNLTIVARFEENPSFGNVERSLNINWGAPKASPGSTTHRALWTKTAPRWMIITLSILLTGVWAHYLFAIISLIRIKFESRKNNLKNS